MRHRGLVCLGALSATFAQPCAAKRFENPYVSFKVPDDWTCKREDNDWTCEPPHDAQGRVSMIVILTAKLVGPTDSPQMYIEHLEDVGRQPGVVVVGPPPHDALIGRVIWLDATLLNSETRNWQTRYLARIEGRVAVLVTFSSNRSATAAAKPISDALASSVQVNSAYVRPEMQAR